MPELTAPDILAQLRARYPTDKGEWVVATEVNQGTGHNMGRRCDFMALSCWPSSQYVVIGVEVKVLRSDWQRELKSAHKQEAIGQFCDEWYVAGPKGIIKPEELPTGWGLLESDGKLLRVAVRATRQAPAPWSHIFRASVLRSIAGGGLTQRELRSEYLRGQSAGVKSLDYKIQQLKKDAERGSESYNTLYKRVEEFERATGIRLNGSGWNCLPAAEVVRIIQSGEHTHMLEEIQRIGQRARAIAKMADFLNEESGETT